MNHQPCLRVFIVILIKSSIVLWFVRANFVLLEYPPDVLLETKPVAHLFAALD
ncbi:hypothetical protein [Scytonema sp. NUACC26]|uniref:hypothetical protein n=1 Tax=Scytonema sp. NUACC26 TaxID=3140176 RepID=UPI0034DC9715